MHWAGALAGIRHRQSLPICALPIRLMLKLLASTAGRAASRGFVGWRPCLGSMAAIRPACFWKYLARTAACGKAPVALAGASTCLSVMISP